MRNASQLIELVVNVARSDRRVSAVLMNGSRVNSKVKPDKYQDFDIVYIVDEISAFTRDHGWVNVFGEIMIMQMPEEMVIGEKDPDSFGYLMIFEDGNRIDLTLFPKNKVVKNTWTDSLTIRLLDKENLFPLLPPADVSSHHIQKPHEKEFQDTCNEFWWMSINVARALIRNGGVYANALRELYARPMLLKMIEWKIGIEQNFSVNVGKHGKYIREYISAEAYQRLQGSYSDTDIEDSWIALFKLLELFKSISNEVAGNLRFNVNLKEQRNAIDYINKLFSEKQSDHGIF